MDRGSRHARIDARPGPLTVDLNPTAVLVIGMQNDFGTEGGMFRRAGVYISTIQATGGLTAHVLLEAHIPALSVNHLKRGHRAT